MSGRIKSFKHLFRDGADRTICSVDGVEGYCAFGIPLEKENGPWKIVRAKSGKAKHEIIPPAVGKAYIFLRVPYDFQSKKLTAVMKKIKDNLGEIDHVERAVWLRKFDELAEKYFDSKGIKAPSDATTTVIDGPDHQIVEEGIPGVLKILKGKKISQFSKGREKSRSLRKKTVPWLKREHKSLRRKRSDLEKEEWLPKLAERFQEKFGYALSEKTIERYIYS